MSYAPTDVTMWDFYNAIDTSGASYITLVTDNDPSKDAVMWASSAYSPATTPNFVMKLTVTSAATTHFFSQADLRFSLGYAVFFVDSNSRVIPVSNGVDGEEYGVDWSSFTGLAIFGGVANVYSYYSATPGQYSSIWPECNSAGSRSGDNVCFSWDDMLPGNKHYLIVAVEDARYVRITICADGISPCRVSHAYDYMLESPLTDLTGPIYLGIASRTSPRTGESFTHIHAVDFYSPTVSCSNNCHGRGFCLGDGSCICHSGFSGVDCATIDCSPACSNGGICIAPDTCQCPVGYGGATCTISKSLLLTI